MTDEKNPRYNTGNPVCDAVHFINDATYAVLPQDIAHKLAEVEKNFWGCVRWFADKELGWIEERVNASDRLREEWRQKCEKSSATSTTTETSADAT